MLFSVRQSHSDTQTSLMNMNIKQKYNSAMFRLQTRPQIYPNPNPSSDLDILDQSGGPTSPSIVPGQNIG